MQWRVGVIPRPPWSVRKGSPQAFRTAMNAHMLQEQNAASDKNLPLQGGGRPTELSASEAKAGGWGSIRSAKMTPSLNLPLSGGGKPHAVETNSVSPEQTRLRLSLMQKLMPFVDDWRCCPAKVCRRHRRCASSALECASTSRKPVTRAAGDAALANLQRALARRSAALSSTEER